MDLTWEPEVLLASPLFESLWPVLRECPAEGFPGTADLDALASKHGTRNANGALITFVAEEKSSRREPESPYEVRVYRDGTVPTRHANWHDLFNALAWITFPRTKAELNRVHYREILARCAVPGCDTTPGDSGSSGTARTDLGSRGIVRTDSGSRGTARTDCGSRGTARDVVTLFDEGGVIVACGDSELSQLLLDFRWKELFWSRRDRVRRAMHFFVFGHAILEKALRPYTGLTAKALVLEVPIAYFRQTLEAQLAEADTAAARYFCRSEALASTRSLSPVPLFGVPGWCPENSDEFFYEDASVFRPGRTRSAG